MVRQRLCQTATSHTDTRTYIHSNIINPSELINPFRIESSYFYFQLVKDLTRIISEMWLVAVVVGISFSYSHSNRWSDSGATASPDTHGCHGNCTGFLDIWAAHRIKQSLSDISRSYNAWNGNWRARKAHTNCGQCNATLSNFRLKI